MNKIIGNILKEARKRNGLTQQQVADMYLSDRQLISSYELSKVIPNAENFILLLDILNTAVLIENGEAKIMEVENMNNSVKESRDLRFEFLNFNLEEKLQAYYKRMEKAKNECIEEYSKVFDLAEEKGLDAHIEYGFTYDMWHMDYAKGGVAFTVSKDNKEIQVEVEKCSYLKIFNLEEFIKDIELTHGEGISKEIFKIITFDAYTFSLSKEIFKLFNEITHERITDSSEISKLLPMINDFENIIFSQLKSKNYIEEVNGLTLNKDDIPIAYLLDIYDEYQSNYLWIKLVLDNYDKIYEPESLDTGVLSEASEYAVHIFDKFDEFFEEWKAEL